MLTPDMEAGLAQTFCTPFLSLRDNGGDIEAPEAIEHAQAESDKKLKICRRVWRDGIFTGVGGHNPGRLERK